MDLSADGDKEHTTRLRLPPRSWRGRDLAARCPSALCTILARLLHQVWLIHHLGRKVEGERIVWQMWELCLPPCFSPRWSCWGFLGLILSMLICRVGRQGVIHETSCASSHHLFSPTWVWAQFVPCPFCQFSFLKGWDNSDVI